MRRGTASRPALKPETHERLAGVLRSPGAPLERHTRRFFESRFGHNLSRVRVHTDESAARSAAAIESRAWTFGNHIAFGSGMYEPQTPHGASLLTHELTHVVQQRGLETARHAENQTSLGLDDLHEQEAEGHRTSATPSISPRVQRSALSKFLDVVLFIPRLFGLEVFPAEDLKKYLAGLKKRKGPQKSLFSDNMARACVSREKELGPYDRQTKIWLIEDMLHGWTSFLDERSILDLLKRSADRKDIVKAIGRSRLWSNFSGGNLRALKALTFTAADFDPTLIEQLRKLPPGQMQDYVKNAVDPDVQKQLQRILQLRGITTPVPGTAQVDVSGVATFQLGGTDIQVEPDETTTDEKYRDFAYTGIRFPPSALNHTADASTNIVQAYSVTPPRTLVVLKTVWGPGFGPSDKAGYGRGTTASDVAAGTTSARFHEGRHGQDLLDYLAAHPVPQFKGATGIPLDELLAKWKEYSDAKKAYIDAAQEYSAKITDCAGEHKIPPDVLKKFGMAVTLCERK